MRIRFTLVVALCTFGILACVLASSLAVLFHFAAVTSDREVIRLTQTTFVLIKQRVETIFNRSTHGSTIWANRSRTFASPFSPLLKTQQQRDMWMDQWLNLNWHATDDRILNSGYTVRLAEDSSYTMDLRFGSGYKKVEFCQSKYRVFPVGVTLDSLENCTSEAYNEMNLTRLPSDNKLNTIAWIPNFRAGYLGAIWNETLTAITNSSGGGDRNNNNNIIRPALRGAWFPQPYFYSSLVYDGINMTLSEGFLFAFATMSFANASDPGSVLSTIAGRQFLNDVAAEISKRLPSGLLPPDYYDAARTEASLYAYNTRVFLTHGNPMRRTLAQVDDDVMVVVDSAPSPTYVKMPLPSNGKTYRNCFSYLQVMACNHNISSHPLYDILKDFAILHGNETQKLTYAGVGNVNDGGLNFLQWEYRMLQADGSRSDAQEMIGFQGKLSNDYVNLDLHLFIFMPMQYFSGAVHEATKTDIVLSVVISVLGAVFLYGLVAVATKPVELLAEKLNADPFDTSLKTRHEDEVEQREMKMSARREDRELRESRRLSQKSIVGYIADDNIINNNNENSNKLTSSNSTRSNTTPFNNNTTEDSSSGTSSSLSWQSFSPSSLFNCCVTIVADRAEDVILLEEQFAEFRKNIDSLRGFMILPETKNDENNIVRAERKNKSEDDEDGKAARKSKEIVTSNNSNNNRDSTASANMPPPPLANDEIANVVAAEEKLSVPDAVPKPCKSVSFARKFATELIVGEDDENQRNKLQDSVAVSHDEEKKNTSVETSDPEDSATVSSRARTALVIPKNPNNRNAFFLAVSQHHASSLDTTTTDNNNKDDDNNDNSWINSTIFTPLDVVPSDESSDDNENGGSRNRGDDSDGNNMTSANKKKKLLPTPSSAEVLTNRLFGCNSREVTDCFVTVIHFFAFQSPNFEQKICRRTKGLQKDESIPPTATTSSIKTTSNSRQQIILKSGNNRDDIVISYSETVAKHIKDIAATVAATIVDFNGDFCVIVAQIRTSLTKTRLPTRIGMKLLGAATDMKDEIVQQYDFPKTVCAARLESNVNDNLTPPVGPTFDFIALSAGFSVGEARISRYDDDLASEPNINKQQQQQQQQQRKQTPLVSNHTDFSSSDKNNFYKSSTTSSVTARPVSFYGPVIGEAFKIERFMRMRAQEQNRRAFEGKNQRVRAAFAPYLLQDEEDDASPECSHFGLEPPMNSDMPHCDSLKLTKAENKKNEDDDDDHDGGDGCVKRNNNNNNNNNDGNTDGRNETSSHGTNNNNKKRKSMKPKFVLAEQILLPPEILAVPHAIGFAEKRHDMFEITQHYSLGYLDSYVKTAYPTQLARFTTRRNQKHQRNRDNDNDNDINDAEKNSSQLSFALPSCLRDELEEFYEMPQIARLIECKRTPRKKHQLRIAPTAESAVDGAIPM